MSKNMDEHLTIGNFSRSFTEKPVKLLSFEGGNKLETLKTLTLRNSNTLTSRKDPKELDDIRENDDSQLSVRSSMQRSNSLTKPCSKLEHDQYDEGHESDRDSFYDSEVTMDDSDLKIPTNEGVPDIVPFATLETGHYLGMNYLFAGMPRQTQIYCLKACHMLVLNRVGLEKVKRFQEDRIRLVKMAVIQEVP